MNYSNDFIWAVFGQYLLHRCTRVPRTSCCRICSAHTVNITLCQRYIISPFNSDDACIRGLELYIYNPASCVLGVRLSLCFINDLHLCLLSLSPAARECRQCCFVLMHVTAAIVCNCVYCLCLPLHSRWQLNIFFYSSPVNQYLRRPRCVRIV